MRWQDGQFTSIPFERPLNLSQDQIATLESYFEAVAEAIRNAQPVETVSIGDVSFLDFFGRTLIKEDFIFSAAEDGQGRLWVTVSWIVDSQSQPDPDIPREAASLCLVTDQEIDCLNRGVTDAAGQVPVRLSTGQIAGRIRVFPFAEVEGGSDAQPIDIEALPDLSKARLVIISGNNQRGEPGQELGEPLVVRLEDQFKNGIGGVEVLATVAAGEAEFADGGSGMGAEERPMRIEATDDQGQVEFQLRVREEAEVEERDIKVRITVPTLEQVVPVQFLAIVGTVDTPDLPLDVAVAENIAFVADRSGLQVIDVSNPSSPTTLHTLDFRGDVTRLAIVGNRAYAATLSFAGPPRVPPRLYVLDITEPEAADFAADANGDRVPDIALGWVNLPANVQSHKIKGVAVQDGFAYIVTDAVTTNTGTLQVVNITDPSAPRIEGNFSPIPVNPGNVAVSRGIAYIPAGFAGIFIVDVSRPSQPRLIG